MARAHGRGSTTPTIPIGTVRGRRADAVSFALAVLSSLAQAWALVGLGRGLGALVAAMVIDLAIGELGLHRVEVCVRPENERSLALCRRLGLHEEGMRRRFMHIAGKWADHVAFSIDRESLPEGGLVVAKWGRGIDE